MLKEIKKFKKPDAKWNTGSYDFTESPHMAKLPAAEKERKDSLSSEGNHWKQKLMQM